MTNTIATTMATIHRTSYWPSYTEVKDPWNHTDTLCRVFVSSARNVEIAETTAPSIMPMIGTSSEDRSETRRGGAKNTMVPTNAKTIAQVMRTRIGAPGHTIMMTSRPSPAHSVVPVVEGSAKRFWVTSCMTRPLIDIAAPDRTSAIVRGTRTARKICQPSSWERIEYSPVDSDRTRSAATASVAKASARGRHFDEAGAASRLSAASVGGAVVGECVIRKRGAGAARGRHAACVSEGHFFAASKASAMELKISV